MQFGFNLLLWTTFVEEHHAPLMKNIKEWGYDGVEGPPPVDPALRREAAAELGAKRIPYIAEIATGGNYVPASNLSVQDHLDDLERQLTDRVGTYFK